MLFGDKKRKRIFGAHTNFNVRTSENNKTKQNITTASHKTERKKRGMNTKIWNWRPPQPEKIAWLEK